MRPIFFAIGPIPISSFGFFAAVSFLVVSFLVWKFSQEELLYSKTSIEDDVLFDAIFLFTLGTFVGARLIFVFSHFGEFGFNLLRWLLIRRASGFSFLGGFLIGTFFLSLFCVRKKLNFWQIFDLFSLSGALALSLGFIGAFLDGVGAGTRTSLPWGVFFVGLEGRRHPVQLLASLFFLASFLILKRVRLFALKGRIKEGTVSLTFLSLAGLILFLLDFLKEGELYLGGVRLSQLIYLAVFFSAGGGLYWRLGRRPRKDLRRVVQFVSSNIKKLKGKGVGGQP